jgi:hypothetical protein
MKNIAKSVLAVIVMGLLLALPSCEKVEDNPGDINRRSDEISYDAFFKYGRRGDELKFNDFALYDSSTHIFYLKEELDEFSEPLGDPKGTFCFLNNGHIIYSGTFLPAYASYIPSGPFIMSFPNMYGNHGFRIEIWLSDGPDVRNCPEIIKVLNEHGLLHSGLAGRVDSIVVDADRLTFGFTIINHDMTDLLIIDLNKTGPNLFHYFTNGLYLRDQDHNNVFSSTIPYQKPEPWNSWKPEWLTLLKSGDSASFTIDYPIENQINPGEYNFVFEFPGFLYQVSKDQLFQGEARIWIGDITLRGKITLL